MSRNMLYPVIAALAICAQRTPIRLVSKCLLS
jgi:hypothetical protein